MLEAYPNCCVGVCCDICAPTSLAGAPSARSDLMLVRARASQVPSHLTMTAQIMIPAVNALKKGVGVSFTFMIQACPGHLCFEPCQRAHHLHRVETFVSLCPQKLVLSNMHICELQDIASTMRSYGHSYVSKHLYVYCIIHFA